MNKSRLSGLTCIVFLTAVFAADSHAGGRPNSSSTWFGHIDGGYNFTSGTTSDFLDSDWTLGGGALYWPSSWPVGVSLDVNYWRMDLSGRSIQAINDAIASDPNNSGQVTGGDFENWHFGVKGVWSLGPSQSEGLYLTGGLSWNSVTGRVTDTGLVYYPPVCDPWFWWCLPGGVGPGSFVVGKRSSDEFGWNIGVGYSLPNTGGRGYAELSYQQIQFANEEIEYIPLTIGFRW